MAQHDYDIANQTGANFRADLNNALAAIVSQNSGSSAPSPTFAYQLWADTTSGLLKIRNAANSAWITVGTLASANLGLASLDGTQTTVSGTTGGSAVISQPFQADGFKVALAWLNAYENDSGSAQTYSFPTDFSHTPDLVRDVDPGAGATGTAVSTTALTLPCNMTGPATGWILVVGF